MQIDVTTKKIIVASAAAALVSVGAVYTREHWIPVAQNAAEGIANSPTAVKIAQYLDTTDMTSWIGDLGQITRASGISWADLLPKDLFNVTHLQGGDIGRMAVENGRTKKDAVILIPGIISSGLEAWNHDLPSTGDFRTRIWAGLSMIKWVVSKKDIWIDMLTLDPETGLDRPPYRVRAAQGLDAASNFIPGYWLWSRLIENLAVVGYDYSDLTLASYDWRLAYYNLEERDKYFSSLKYRIEFNKNVLGRKTTLVSHSMGGNIVLWFLKWVESEKFGKGGRKWAEDHIANFVNLSGPVLGVPKAVGAVLSGEMSDTVNLNPIGTFLLEKYFDRLERADLFRSWPGVSSMLPKGGDVIWGNATHAPDRIEENPEVNWGNLIHFRPLDQVAKNDAESHDDDIVNFKNIAERNMTLSSVLDFLDQEAPASFSRMLATNFSHGFESNPKVIKKNENDHTKFINPLETALPAAPSMNIYCLYGTGVRTERAFFYRHAIDKAQPPQNASRVWMDPDVDLPDVSPGIYNGVMFGEGDGTVSLLSLGAMCVGGWKRSAYNPAHIPVTTREYPHNPTPIDPRGGPGASDHVNVLGNHRMIHDVIEIVTGHGGDLGNDITSNVTTYAERINWDSK